VGSCGHVLSRDAINAFGWGDWLPGLVLGQGARRNGQSGGEFLSTHVYRNEEKRRCGFSQV
jgi:hypothetical protein